VCGTLGHPDRLLLVVLEKLREEFLPHPQPHSLAKDATEWPVHIVDQRLIV
jgi:hypothetical protein